MSPYRALFTPARLQTIFDEVASEFSGHLDPKEIHALGHSYTVSFGFQVETKPDFRSVLSQMVRDRKSFSDDIGFSAAPFRVITRIFEKQLEHANLTLK